MAPKVVDEAGVETKVHRIRSGEQTITVTMARRPTRAGIDPNRLLTDLTTDDARKIRVQS